MITHVVVVETNTEEGNCERSSTASATTDAAQRTHATPQHRHLKVRHVTNPIVMNRNDIGLIENVCT